jgi:hypothetical protein
MTTDGYYDLFLGLYGGELQSWIVEVKGIAMIELVGIHIQWNNNKHYIFWLKVERILVSNWFDKNLYC